MKRPIKRMPKFHSESEERAFWESHDTTEYFDWSKAERVVSESSTVHKTISIRLPENSWTESGFRRTSWMFLISP